jgi:hypothetical protein
MSDLVPIRFSVGISPQLLEEDAATIANQLLEEDAATIANLLREELIAAIERAQNEVAARAR